MAMVLLNDYLPSILAWRKPFDTSFNGCVDEVLLHFLFEISQRLDE